MYVAGLAVVVLLPLTQNNDPKVGSGIGFCNFPHESLENAEVAWL